MTSIRNRWLGVEKNYCKGPTLSKISNLPPDHVSEIIQMALSDHVSFSDIQVEYGINDKQVKTLMRDTLKSGSYRAWRKRVRDFGDRREIYK
jgi:uncharacterized protein (TIGR03643 family)